MRCLRGIKEKSHWIEPHQIVLLIGLSIAIAFIFEPVAHPGSIGDFVPTLYAINLTGNVLTFGVPFVIASIILWNTKKAHTSMAQKDALLHHRIRCYVTRYVITNMITSLVMAGVCMWGFSSAAANPAHLPGVIFASMGISFILNSFTFFIAIAVDAPLYTIFVNTSMLAYFSFYYGYSVLSATSVMSLYAPYHLFRFLAIFLSGHEFINESIMENYVGIVVQPIDLLGPLLVWSLVSGGCIVGSIILLRHSMERWVHESTTSEGKTEFTQESTREKTVSAVERRQKIASLGVILLFVSTAFFNLFVNSPPEIPENMYLYQSPESRENIALGSWSYDTVEVSSTQIAETEGWTLKVTILDWDEYDGGEGLRVRYGFLIYSLSDFAALNNTEKENIMISRTWAITPDHPSTGTSVHHQLDGAGTYLWAIRITDDSHKNASYVVSAKIEVYLNPV
ncbi:MAG: hypothetical protein GF309_09930 [Candidatus Lokiarchaeota archaeon]|nr:hypothetical protein [Candidatus Lokiarchaeota archaeon]